MIHSNERGDAPAARGAEDVVDEHERGTGIAYRNAVVARRAFDALDRHDIAGFMQLCDSEVELCRFTSPPEQNTWQNPEYAMMPIHGREAIVAWLEEVFDAYPGIRFVLEDVDLVGDSVFCDARFSLGEHPPLPRSFVMTMDKGRLVGFEIFHPDTEGVENTARYSMAWGQFRVRGRANKITPPRPCAWVFHKDDRGVPTSVRIYPTKARALEAVREEDD